MSVFQKLWNRFFPPVQTLPAGVYHCQMPSESGLPHRLHLRVEPDGHGLLIIDASTVVHLNQTATEYAFHLVRSTEEEQAVAELSRRYNVAREIIRRDFAEMTERLRMMADTQDLDPVSELNFERHDPYSRPGSAPYRIDCALTYRLPDESAGHLAPLDRVARELTTDEWKAVLEKAWNAGVPHAIFTGGEPTLRPDLVELVDFAEKLGMVTGLITDGSRLSEPKYLHALLQAGLDHVMILLETCEDECWEALRDTLAEDIAVTVHLTIRKRGPEGMDALLQRLAGMGVKRISISAESPEQRSAMLALQQQAAALELRLVWDLPVPYSHFNPVAMGDSGEEPLAEALRAADEVFNGDGSAWLYVEPDGDVLPGQDRYQDVLGNLRTDPWRQVWERAQAEPAE
jgi:organic radical activating enzyme